MIQGRVLLALVAISFVGVSARGQEAYLEFPFETISHKAWIEVRVNESEPLSYVLDTGAPGFHINTSTAVEIGLSVHGIQESRGGGAGTGAVTTSGSHGGYVLKLGGGMMIVSPSAGGLIGLDGVSAYEGRRMDGLIGGMLFQRWVVEVDYPREMIRLYEPDDFVYEGDGKRVEIVDFLGHIPVVRGTITSADGEVIEARFGVDTGSRMPLGLSTPFAARHGFGKGEGREETVGGGIGGEARGVVVQADRFVMGSGAHEVMIDGLTVCASTDRGGFMAGRAVAGLIGGPILSRGKVIFDYSRREMIVEVEQELVEYDISGLFLTAIGEDFDEYKVMSVRRGSAAERAGLMRGDVITHVNREPSGAFTLEWIRRMLREPGRVMTLVFDRRGERRSIVFRNPGELDEGRLENVIDGTFVRPILR